MNLSLICLLKLPQQNYLKRKNLLHTFKENKEIAKRGGKFAGETRERYEKEMGRKIISPANANDKKLLDDKKNND